MSSGDESIDIPDEIEVIEEVEGDNDNPIETIETGEETAQNNEGKESDDEESKKVVKAKRVVRNPQPKLNEQTLRTKKGLTAIPNHFKRVKFKGRGYEAQDLNVLMKTYEYWCHRMYPKFPFDACIAKLETLGTKKGTQVLLKKIRLGMEICDDDKKIASDEEQEGETPITEGFVDTFDNRFDQLLSGTNGTDPTAAPKTTGAQLHPADQETTEEQLERIRQNRLRAEALRKQRLEKMKANIQENPTTSSSSRNEIGTKGDKCLEEEVDLDISSSVNKKTSRLNDSSSDEEDAVSQKTSGRKKTQMLSSDDEEMHVDSRKPTTSSSSRIEIGTQDDTCLDEEIDLDNISSSVNKETQKSAQKKTFLLNGSSSDEDAVSQKSSGRKRTQVLSSDDEEMHVDPEKPTNDKSENSSNSIQRKKVQTIESDDESQGDTRTEVRTQDETRTSAMEEDNEEVDLDNILSIINEDAETLVPHNSDGSGTILNKRSSDENNSIDNVTENNYASIQQKEVQSIENSDEMDTIDNVTDTTSSDDIPKKSDEFDNSASTEDNLKETFPETAEAKDS